MKMTLGSLFALFVLSVAVVALTSTNHAHADAGTLKAHRIFSDNMGLRAARRALNQVYDLPIDWDTASLVPIVRVQTLPRA
jgi:hypothetical protein